MTLKKKLLRFVGVLSLAVCTQVLLTGPSIAQSLGDLIVAPTRIVFEDRTRSAKITLANRGSGSAVFRISFVEMEMSAEGRLQRIEDPTQVKMAASSMIRYAPRQIEIAPGETQTIRLSLRRPSDLADGEYRSHMYFRAVPPESAGRSVEDTDETADGLQLQLIPIFGVSIPVIVRQGDVSVSASVSNVQLLPQNEEAPLRVAATITREGSRSAFGDVTATFSSAGGGEPLVISQASRLAVYTNLDARNVTLPVALPDGVELTNGTIDVTYKASEENGGAVMGSGSVVIP